MMVDTKVPSKKLEDSEDSKIFSAKRVLHAFDLVFRSFCGTMASPDQPQILVRFHSEKKLLKNNDDRHKDSVEKTGRFRNLPKSFFPHSVFHAALRANGSSGMKSDSSFCWSLFCKEHAGMLKKFVFPLSG